MKNLPLTITAISDPQKMDIVNEKINAFISQNTQNPFLLQEFLSTKMQQKTKKSFPIILVLTIHSNIVGVVPLLIEKKLGIRSARFLLNYYFSPDFTFSDEYRKLCMKSCLNFVFNRLRCCIGNFDLPLDSPNFSILEQTCIDLSVTVVLKRDTIYNHAVLSVKSSWETFQQLKGKNFTKKMRQIERRIENTGISLVEFFENEQNAKHVFDRIMDVEKGCWKNYWRLRKDISQDQDLLDLWSWSNSELKVNADFNRHVWFLSMNGKTIAYNLAIIYRGTAYMCKTSFDNSYKSLYPGIYVINVAVRDLFNSGSVRLVDFMTNLPFHARWTRTYQERVRFKLSTGTLPKLYSFIIRKSPKQLIERVNNCLLFMDRLRG